MSNQIDDILAAQVMSNELVKRLRSCSDNCIPEQLRHDIIAYITSTPSRDEVLEEAKNAQPSTAAEPKTDYEVWFLHGVLAYGRAIRAIKSTPTFTRKDGTTSPLRGTVEDRRESAKGDPDTHGYRRGSYQPGIAGATRYGRRSNDRARWTGEAAPVVAEDACGRAPYKHHWQTTPHGHDICVECKQTRATQPAQEAPQPEKPGLVEETLRDRLAMAALTGLLAANVTYGGGSDNRGALSRDAYATADAMLDARQGEK